MSSHPYPIREKEVQPVAGRGIRARVRAGRLEPLERLPFVEGDEVWVTANFITPVIVAHKTPVKLHTWNLGVKMPITREDIYGDVD